MGVGHSDDTGESKLDQKIRMSLIFPLNKVQKWPEWINFIASASHLLIVFNSSVNFFIYLAKYRQRKLDTAGSTEMDTMVLN